MRLRLYVARLYLNTEEDGWEDGINYGADRVLVLATDEETASERAMAHWAVRIDQNADTEPGVGVNQLTVDGQTPDMVLL